MKQYLKDQTNVTKPLTNKESTNLITRTTLPTKNMKFYFFLNIKNKTTQTKTPNSPFLLFLNMDETCGRDFPMEDFDLEVGLQSPWYWIGWRRVLDWFVVFFFSFCFVCFFFLLMLQFFFFFLRTCLVIFIH